jgi:hypothetical protein
MDCLIMKINKFNIKKILKLFIRLERKFKRKLIKLKLKNKIRKNKKYLFAETKVLLIL